VPRRSLYGTYGAALFSMSLSDLLGLLVPLWALSLDVTPTQLGMLVGARSAVPFALGIHGGALMGRFGPRRVMLFFAALTGCLAPFYPAATWFPALLCLQIVVGFSANMGWMGAQTLIAQVTRGDPTFIGRFSFFGRVGTFVAPVVVGFIWDTGGPVPAFLCLSLWSGLLFVSVYSTPIPSAVATPPRQAGLTARELLPRFSDYATSLSLIFIPAIALAIAISILRHATMGIQASFYIVYLKDVGLLATAIGTLLATAEIMNGVGSLLAGRVVRTIPAPWVMVGFTALGITAIAITPLLGGIFILLMLAQGIRGSFWGVVQPIIFSIQARAVDDRLQGSVVGLRVTLNHFASMLTPVVMGLVVEAFGIRTGFLLTGGVLILICGILASILRSSPALRRAGQ